MVDINLRDISKDRTSRITEGFYLKITLKDNKIMLEDFEENSPKFDYQQENKNLLES